MGTHIHALSPSYLFFLSEFVSLTLRWRGRSSARPSWATCRSPSQSGRGRTLFSGPGERRCARWGLDSANPAGCDLVTRHFLLHNWSTRRGGKVWRLERTEIKHHAALPARRNQWFEIKLSVNLSASACVMEMRGGMRRGRVVGRETLFRTSGERVRSRGRSQQGTCRVRRKGL